MSLTRVRGILVGHAADQAAATGCTVVLCPDGAIAGCDVGGGASGARETAACRPDHLAGKVHAILLAGGSAFGLDAAGGVMSYLEDRGIGFDTGAARVPIVPAAVIYDLGIGSATVRPGPAIGLAACHAASAGPVASGSVGAGTGATTGKINGIARSTKSGVGNGLHRLPARAGGATVAALAVVNAFGDIRHPGSGAIIAGARRSPRSALFSDTAALMRRGLMRKGFRAPNTTLVVVATDARLDRVGASRLARQCQDGLATCIRPAHTRLDGDIVFVLSTGGRRADPDCLAVAACRAIEEAVVDAVLSATSLAGIPAVRDLSRRRRPGR